MRKDEKKVSLIRRYLKTIMASVISAFSIGFAVPLWIATSKLNSIKVGEYPGMPQDQINKQYDEVLPSVILDSILLCLAITLFASIPFLLLRFKQNHNINLFREFMKYINMVMIASGKLASNWKDRLSYW